MEELIKRLQRYSEQCIADRLDPDFAAAIIEAINVLSLCQMLGAKPEPPKFESCPFCGSDDVTYIETENQNYEIHVEGFIFCRGCGFASDIFLDKSFAIEAWNRRDKK